MPTTTVPFQNTDNVPAVPRPDITEADLAPRLFGPDYSRREQAELYSGLGSKEQIERELDGIGAAIRSFHAKAPDQVFEECSAYSARLSELYILLHRVENSPYAKDFYRVRTQQVEIYRTELEFQFKLASRKVEVARHDIVLSGAGT